MSLKDEMERVRRQEDAAKKMESLLQEKQRQQEAYNLSLRKIHEQKIQDALQKQTDESGIIYLFEEIVQLLEHDPNNTDITLTKNVFSYDDYWPKLTYLEHALRWKQAQPQEELAIWACVNQSGTVMLCPHTFERWGELPLIGRSREKGIETNDFKDTIPKSVWSRSSDQLHERIAFHLIHPSTDDEFVYALL